VHEIIVAVAPGRVIGEKPKAWRGRATLAGLPTEAK